MTLLVLFNQPSGGGGNYTLTASAGSYSLAGAAASLYRSRNLPAVAGSYAYSGVAATITYTPVTGAYTITAVPGSYSLAGAAATVRKSKVLLADTGSYSYAGQAASINFTPLTPVISRGMGGGGGIGSRETLARRKKFNSIFDELTKPTPSLLSAADKAEILREVRRPVPPITINSPEEEDEELAAIMLLLF